ncbi:LEAF RUST 10 DISEASE-RESISTANCE LOCUS RECEPTOR-LIKE PROTEIN KINASE 2.1 [Trifolium repens]|nr:LEAF RUST 10 DISEASE-RESISTANCE LOCUS RECEPTOR-LIKE PROTEIN KINASE 2.1 [Trifolium repens]
MMCTWCQVSNLVNFAVLECKNSIQVPGLKNSFANNSDSAVNILNEGFEVQWSGVEQDTCDGCIRSGERRGYNTSKNADVLYPHLSPDLMQPSHVSCFMPLH